MKEQKVLSFVQKTIPVTVTIPKEMWERIEAVADANNKNGKCQITSEKQLAYCIEAGVSHHIEASLCLMEANAKLVNKEEV